jgi:hypothetical protein
MSWSDEDDLFEDGMSKKIHRKPRKHFERQDGGPEDEANGAGYRRKRAGKRSHRIKNHKDEFWDGDDRR